MLGSVLDARRVAPEGHLELLGPPRRELHGEARRKGSGECTAVPLGASSRSHRTVPARKPPPRPARRHPLGRDPGLRPAPPGPARANDSWIAARCLVRELPPATINNKDYADFAEHEDLQLVH